MARSNKVLTSGSPVVVGRDARLDVRNSYFGTADSKMAEVPLQSAAVGSDNRKHVTRRGRSAWIS